MKVLMKRGTFLKSLKGDISKEFQHGFNVLFTNGFLLGIFGEYSYEKQSISPKTANVFSSGKVQLGGLAVGASLGYAF
jgi:hypothetical protein